MREFWGLAKLPLPRAELFHAFLDVFYGECFFVLVYGSYLYVS
jgi:hypothetical protein